MYIITQKNNPKYTFYLYDWSCRTVNTMVPNQVLHTLGSVGPSVAYDLHQTDLFTREADGLIM